MTKKDRIEEYDSQQIQVLEGLEAVRKRPGMYIGSSSESGLHHLVWEIVDNAVDEHLAGRCDFIDINIDKDNIIHVTDNGAGFPVGIHEKTGRPAVETALTVLHAGGKFGGGGYKVSGGLHGVGASVVNALSRWMRVEVYRDQKIYEQEYERGVPLYDLRVIGKTDKTGTKVSFQADDEIFKETTTYKYQRIYDRLKETAYLCPDLTIRFTDSRNNKNDEVIFHFPGGLVDFVKEFSQGKELINEEPIYFEDEMEKTQVQAVLQYQDNYERFPLYSYANNVNTHEGGMHETGFKSGLKKAIIEYVTARQLIKKEKLEIEDMLNGLICIISVKVEDPEFEGQTKTKLGNSDARKIVDKITYEKLSRFFEEHPNVIQPIVQKIINAYKIRMELKIKREETLKANKEERLSFGGMAKKLTDCISKDNTKTEIYIVEGDSAGGSAKQGRDRTFQAILPLRGKIQNILKKTTDKILANEEIRSLRLAVGTGFAEEFDYEKRRYAKVVIMTDADQDGSHIRVLLLTLFFIYMPELIERGHIYIANPPLYKIQKGKQIQYAYNDRELDEYFEKNTRNGVNIQRYKGLGEMNHHQLWETTMNPETRILTKVTMEDAEAATEIIQILMGEKVEPRKEFITENAEYAVNIDV